MSTKTPLPKLLGYRVLVQLDNPLAEDSKLQIPDGVRTTLDRTQGVVVALGDGRLSHPNQDKVVPISLEVGNRVWLSDMVQPVMIDGTFYAIASCEDVFAVVPEGMIIVRP